VSIPFWAEIECTMDVALLQPPINRFNKADNRR
jgi:hypothetical protein